MSAENKSTIRNRLIPRNEAERSQIIPIGGRHVVLHDIYARLLGVSWRRMLGTITLLYFTINLAFAICYYNVEASIENARPGSFQDAFFFSVQTLATIGYGKMAPVGMLANIFVTIEACMGFCFYAMITGLVFTKFSRPTARVMFSNVAVICPYNGVPHLMFRIANERGNRIVDAIMQMVVFRTEVSAEGLTMRRFYDVELVRKQIPVLQLTWTVMHKIDEKSPFFNMSKEALATCDSEIIVSLTGLDETLSQTIHTRFSYLAEEIEFNAAFVDIINRRNDRQVEINYNNFHQTHPFYAKEA